MLVQNYSNLTLDNMTLTLNNPNYASAYTLSNNNGNVVIDDTTINANPAGAFAFDVCRYASYPSVNVTVTGDSVINGDVEVYASGSDPKNGFSLTLESGEMNGDIVVDATAAAAIAATPEKAVVTKDDDFTQAAPEGYEWVSNGDGTSTLAPVQDLFLKHSISVNGYINLNFYLNPALVGPGTTVNFAWTVNGTNKTASYKLTEDDLYADGYKATVSLPAAEMNYQIKATVDNFNNDVDYYSVRDYCDVILSDEYEATYTAAYGEEKYAKLEALVLNMLDYGAKAQIAFDRTDVDLANKGVEIDNDDVTDTMIDLAIEAANPGASADDMETVATALGGKYYTTTLFFLAGNKIRHIFTPTTYPGSLDNRNDYTEVQADYYYCKDSSEIAAAELDTLQTFKIGDTTFKYSALDYVKAVLNSGMDPKYKNLAASTYWYNFAANNYFNA